MMNYYHGNFFGKSIAYEMYEMSQQLNRESNEFLWLWIIGLTYQYLHLKITQIQYQEMLSECQREVIRLNGSDIYANNISANIPTDEFGGETDITLKSFNIKQGSIFIEEDFRFMLLRHWNLYDAAYYSNYLASKFGIWKVLIFTYIYIYIIGTREGQFPQIYSSPWSSFRGSSTEI